MKTTRFDVEQRLKNKLMADLSSSSNPSDSSGAKFSNDNVGRVLGHQANKFLNLGHA